MLENPDTQCRETVESGRMERGAGRSVRFTQSPLKQAAEAVSERAASWPGATVASSAAGMTPATTGRTSGANVSGLERAGVTAGRDPQSIQRSERGEGGSQLTPPLGDTSFGGHEAGKSPAAHKRSKLRPNCLNPGDLCAGVGARECFACRSAAAKQEAA